MIEFENLILNNPQFQEICNQNLTNAFLFESTDPVFLENFSYCFAKRLLCLNNLVCNECLNCKKVSMLSHADLKIYPKNNKSIVVEDIKDLIENINLTPMESDKKVFILNNFSFSTIQAQNKLLKILEEPPKNAYIILNVSNINKVLPTIMSRCKKIRLIPLTNAELNKHLTFKSEEEKKVILDLSSGSLTKALEYLNNEEFFSEYNKVFDTLLEMKDSRQLLKYAMYFNKNKNAFLIALEIFENIFRDVLVIRLNKTSLVTNKNFLDKLKEISLFLTADALDQLIKKIYEIRKKLEFNCNFVLLVDNFLLYYLEVKFLCKK